MASRRTGRKWRIVGSVLKAGKRVKRMTKIVVADSEAKIEKAEKSVRNSLGEQVTKLYKGKELKDVRIEVESDIY